jgi:hypothetical protein
VQLDATNLGSLVSPSELRSLFEGGLLDATRHFLRATTKPDPHRTLADSVAAASALSQAIAARAPDVPSTPSVPRPARPNRRILLAGDLMGAGHQDDDPCEIFDWEDPEWGQAEETVICYSGPPQRQQRSRVPNNQNRLFRTCWIPGHFSEECLVIPDHFREEITARKRIALMALRKERLSQTMGTPQGWYQQRTSSPLPASPAVHGQDKNVSPADIAQEKKTLGADSKKEPGWDSTSQ